MSTSEAYGYLLRVLLIVIILTGYPLWLGHIWVYAGAALAEGIIAVGLHIIDQSKTNLTMQQAGALIRKIPWALPFKHAAFIACLLNVVLFLYTVARLRF